MDDGSAVILSVAKYYSPSGKSIQDNGVTPTVQVAEAQPTVEDEDENAPEKAPETTKPSDDQLLKKAVDVLMGRDTASAQPGAHPDGQVMTPLNVPQPSNR
jgi:carboxyl-terminal processing protease